MASEFYIFTDADGKHYYTRDGNWVPCDAPDFDDLWSCLDKANAAATANALRNAGVEVRIERTNAEWDDAQRVWVWEGETVSERSQS